MISINTKIGTINANGIEVISTVECGEGSCTLLIRSNSALGRDWRYEFTDFDGDAYHWVTDQAPECGKDGSYNPDDLFQFSATIHEVKKNGRHWKAGGQLVTPPSSDDYKLAASILAS